MVIYSYCFVFQACVKCCRYIEAVRPELLNALDGKNLEVVLTEFGTRFHKLLLDHLYQYTFTDVGRCVFLCRNAVSFVIIFIDIDSTCILRFSIIFTYV